MASAVLAVLCSFLYALICWRQTVVFLTSEDAEVEIKQKSNGQSIGFTTKQVPLKERWTQGQHDFIASADGYDDAILSVRTETRWWSLPPERHVFIDLPARPVFNVTDPSVDGVRSNEPSQRPAQGPLADDGEIAANVFATLRFTLASPSAGPLEVSDLFIKVVRATPRKDWTFPYFGEATEGATAAIDQGYAIIERRMDKYRVREAPPTKLVGRKQPSAEYAITIHCEPAWTYTLAVEFRWRDVNNPTRFGRKELQLVVLEAPRRWQGLLKSTPLRILYNARVDVLKRSLDSQAVRPGYTILVADTKGEEYFRDNRLKQSNQMAILPQGMLKELEAKHLVEQAAKVSPQGPAVTPRPCGFIAFDEKTVLVQKRDDLRRGVLIDSQDPTALIAEYDRLAKKVLKP